MLAQTAQLQNGCILSMAKHLLHMQPSAPIVCVDSAGELTGSDPAAKARH
jgi:hypothetical protein